MRSRARPAMAAWPKDQSVPVRPTLSLACLICAASAADALTSWKPFVAQHLADGRCSFVEPERQLQPQVPHTRASCILCTAPSDAAILEGPSCAIPTGVRAETEVSMFPLTLQVADSVAVPGELGLFARLRDGVSRVVILAGSRLCSYGVGRFAPRAEGDRAVPFAFSDAQQLVLFGDPPTLRPLQAVVADTDATALFAHRVRRYGPKGAGARDASQAGVMLSIDSAHAERYFVPLDLARGRLERERDTDEMTADATEVARDHIQIAPNEFGQFCNDLAFDADLLSRHDAAWRYAEASQRNNLLQLVWQVALIEDKEINVDRDDDHVSDGHSELNGTGDLTIFSEDRDEHGTSRGVRELRPLQLACIASRDVVMQMPGVSVELGCHYGLDYWRGRLTDYSDAPRPQ